MTYMGGHWVRDRFMGFPHLCPGLDCAISRWLRAQHFRDYRQSYWAPTS